MNRGWFLPRKLRRRVVILSTVWCGTTSTASWRKSWQRASRWDSEERSDTFLLTDIGLGLHYERLHGRVGAQTEQVVARMPSMERLMQRPGQWLGIARLIAICRVERDTCRQRPQTWIYNIASLSFILKSHSDITDLLCQGNGLFMAWGRQIFIIPVILICMGSCNWSLLKNWKK